MVTSSPDELRTIVFHFLNDKDTEMDKIKLLHMLYFTIAMGDSLAKLKSDEFVNGLWKQAVDQIAKEFADKIKK